MPNIKEEFYELQYIKEEFPELPSITEEFSELQYNFQVDRNEICKNLLHKRRLENVMSVQEARSIKLAGKERMEQMQLNWTKDAERFVEDMEVLGELVPPTTLEYLTIAGYNSVRVPE